MKADFELWSDKYAPESLEEFIGHTETLQFIRDWADSWDKGNPQMPILLSGPPGIGKTLIAMTLVKEHGWELLELNASDLRSAWRINKIAGHAAVSRTFSGNLRLILFDEVDGLYREDTGGAGAIVKVLKEAFCPIILTANNVWDPKLSPIRSACKKIDMRRIHYATIAKYLEKIAKKEGLDVDKKILMQIARNCSGDVRSAINDLQILTQGIKKVTEEDLKVLGERDREQNIFNTVMTILKTRDLRKSRESLENLEEDPDFILKWIDENLPKEYTKPEELYRAYDRVSRADVFLGRVYNRQYYGLWKYATDLMSSGVSLAKEETYKGFTRLSFPGVIKYMSASKPEREVRKSIALKVGKLCHVSSSTAIKDYLPMIFEFMKDKEMAVRLTAQFDLTEEELDFLKVKSTAKVLEEASELRVKAIAEASRPKPDKKQRALHHF